MPSTNFDQQCWQEIKASSSSSTTRVPARWDEDTGEFSVRWSDIQDKFEHAASVRYGNDVKELLVDSDLNYLEPKRIRYCHNTVLEVVMQGHPEVPISAAQVFPNIPAASSKYSRATITRATSINIATASTNSVSQALETLSISRTSFDSNHLAQSADTMTEALLVLDRPSNPNSPRAQAILTNQVTMTEAMSTAINTAINTAISTAMNTAMNTTINTTINAAVNKAFQELYQAILDDRALSFEILQNQRKFETVQQTEISLLEGIRDRVEVAITQNRELHESTIPGLFIILPKARRFRVGNLLEDHYRLYFLCECDDHTKSAGSEIPHDVHLAKHDGYDIKLPAAFFTKYSQHLLTTLKWVKRLLSVASLANSAVGYSGILDGIEGIQKYLDLATDRHFVTLVDEAIAFMQSQTNPSGGIDAGSSQNLYDEIKSLKGADLRRLETFLHVNDQAYDFGNLSRIVTKEGYVKWVCEHHFSENFRASDMQELEEVIQSNSGTFIKAKGRIEITIASRTKAELFYNAIRKTGMIQELDIALQWKVTHEDLRVFAEAVWSANIVHLTMDGEKSKIPFLDFFNSSRRYNPIMEIMCNGRLKSLRLKDFEKFFNRVSNSAIMNAPQLRALAISSVLPSKTKVSSAFVTRIFKMCPYLTELDLNSGNWNFIFDLLRDNISGLERLETVNIGSGRLILTVSSSQGKIKHSKATIDRLDDLKSEEERFLTAGHLKALHVTRTPSQGTRVELLKVLDMNPDLSEICVGCRPEQALDTIKLITEKRTDIMFRRSSCALRQFNLCEDKGCPGDNGKSDDILHMALSFPDSALPTCNISTNIRMRASFPSAESRYLLALFKDYGSTIEQLHTNHAFYDDLATFLDNGTKTKGSSLVHLTLNPAMLTLVGLDCVNRVIERSSDLGRLELHLDRLEESDNMEKAVQLLRRHGGRLHSLTLQGDATESWMPTLATELPTRLSLPKLDTFRIICRGSARVLEVSARWLVAMVSGPSQQAASSSLSTSITVQSASTSDSHQEWWSLKNVSIENVQFENEDWKDMIEKMDFTSLESLSFSGSNFSLDQLQILVRSLPEYNGTIVPLQSLKASVTRLDECEDIESLKEAFVMLRNKAIAINVEGIKKLD
ncbi:hypothetical protein BC939DRAFT_115139 [Gamsiella multidivaricata]|uniref:uncharacterized protein n=1 Tax=Gamsiella multidivaricata TaxID=101098 RepID=UPI00221FAC21|nr:uncharacterized protein BC939DRAFT_115139 [Gamsiella multidivaricata]KAI7826133.1 hypothetical protein BC939DRAFT_115139 [Gamsiella multidivaricata]